MLRQTLGDFSSIICLKAMITGMENALGDQTTAIALTSAGRTRGKNIAIELGLSTSNLSLEELTSKLNYAFGVNGTRLCVMERIDRVGDIIKIYTKETVCSAGEVPGSDRKCTYTLGVIWGAVSSSLRRFAIEHALGKRLQGKQTESVLRGGSHDVFELRELPEITEQK